MGSFGLLFVSLPFCYSIFFFSSFPLFLFLLDNFILHTTSFSPIFRGVFAGFRNFSSLTRRALRSFVSLYVSALLVPSCRTLRSVNPMCVIQPPLSFARWYFPFISSFLPLTFGFFFFVDMSCVFPFFTFRVKLVQAALIGVSPFSVLFASALPFPPPFFALVSLLRLSEIFSSRPPFYRVILNTLVH